MLLSILLALSVSSAAYASYVALKATTTLNVAEPIVIELISSANGPALTCSISGNNGICAGTVYPTQSGEVGVIWQDNGPPLSVTLNWFSSSPDVCFTTLANCQSSVTPPFVTNVASSDGPHSADLWWQVSASAAPGPVTLTFTISRG